MTNTGENTEEQHQNTRQWFYTADRPEPEAVLFVSFRPPGFRVDSVHLKRQQHRITKHVPLNQQLLEMYVPCPRHTNMTSQNLKAQLYSDLCRTTSITVVFKLGPGGQKGSLNI